jgi:hypothetical protein
MKKTYCQSCSRLVGGLAAILCTACVTTAPYQETASRLTQELYDWRPLRKDRWYEISDEERARSEQHLQSCVSELTSAYQRSAELARSFHENVASPSREKRVMDLVICMEEKGWHLVPVEVYVTS